MWVQERPDWGQTPLSSGSGAKQLFAGLAIGTGLFGIVKPEWAWFLKDGWQFRDAEPSHLALLLYRAGGTFSLIIGVAAA